MSSYYDTVRYPSVFLQRAKDYANFVTLSQSPGFQSGANNWDARYLFASRVICTAPEWHLLFLDGFFPEHLMEVHPCIQDLIAGPLDLQLAELWEPQIVQLCQPDSLGYVWAALAPFVRAERTSAVERGNSEEGDSTEGELPSTPERPRRERTQAVYDHFVPSDSFVIGSSSPNRPPTSSGASEHSIGYRGKVYAPLLEDATIRLASSFVRCVLNYAQPIDKAGPFVHFRDVRLTHRYQTSIENVTVEAIDDGGLQLLGRNGALLQVALLEGKRAFQTIVDGKPRISDELLAQLVGEALALSQSETSLALSTDVMSILAVSDCVKFFRFKFSPEFIQNYETVPMLDNMEDNFLQVDSTEWLSIKTPDHRELIVSHLLAIISWADTLV
ncbi:hypothetical protein TrVFT333_008726 [Trichoderma virens FT-333]|nr:hypothetical protein TrVFT333_008726 [Trichoderma virens FT-333]